MQLLNRKLYSYKGGNPKVLPELIPTESGNFLTNSINLSDKVLEENGYIRVEDKPETNNRFSYVTWENGWVIKDISDEEKSSMIESQWEKIRMERDFFIRQNTWRYERIARRERLGLNQIDNIDELDVYIQELANLPESQQDPFNIIWPKYNDPENK